MGRSQHGGLLQPDQHAVRHHHGVLHGGVVRGDVGGAQVRVPLGRRAHRQEAHQVLRAQVHRLPHDVGAGPTRRRDALPLQNRRAVPQELPHDGEDDSQAAVPRVRAHLPPALPRGGAARRGGAPQHLLQTLHLLRAGVQPDRAAGAGAAAGAHREAHGQGGAMSRPPRPPPPAPPHVYTLTVVSLGLHATRSAVHSTLATGHTARRREWPPAAVRSDALSARTISNPRHLRYSFI